MPETALEPKVKPKGKTPKAYNGKSIIDVGKALKMRLDKRMSYEEIGKQFNVSGSAVYERLLPFKKYIDNPDYIQAFNESKSNILSVVENEIVSRMLERDTLKKASLNNLAYSLQSVNNINRLEQGKATQNININSMVNHVNTEIQRATEQLRKLEQSINTNNINELEADLT